MNEVNDFLKSIDLKRGQIDWFIKFIEDESQSRISTDQVRNAERCIEFLKEFYNDLSAATVILQLNLFDDFFWDKVRPFLLLLSKTFARVHNVEEWGTLLSIPLCNLSTIEKYAIDKMLMGLKESSQ